MSVEAGAAAADAERARAAAALARRIAAGDRAAEDELVERYGRGVRYLLRHLTRDPEWSEDLFQETFAIAIEKLRAGELRDPEKLPPFLRGTARNLVLAGRRRRRRSRLIAAAEMAADGTAPAVDPPDPAPGPLGALLLDESIELARSLLAELASPRDRAVLFRFCVAEEDKQSICADLGLTSPQFNLVLFRARRRFGALYAAARRRRPASRGRASAPLAEEGAR